MLIYIALIIVVAGFSLMFLLFVLELGKRLRKLEKEQEENILELCIAPVNKKVEEIKFLRRMTSGAVGYDIIANERVIVPVGQSKTIKTGFATAFTEGFEAAIRGRSGLEARFHMLKLGGTIDPDYRGEWIITLLNLGLKLYEIKKGDRVAQVVFRKVYFPKMKIVNKLPDTKRAGGGFGSTGK